MKTYWHQLCFLLAGLVASSATANDALFRQWDGAVKKGDEEEVLKVVRQVRPPSADAPWAIAEAARVLYAKERWSEFFGLTSFARKVYPSSLETEKIRLLELLALLRHCQWEKAREVIADGKNGKTEEWKEGSAPIAELLDVLPRLSDDDKPKDLSKGARGLLPQSRLYPVTDSNIAKLDPHRLRRKMESRCQ